MSGLGRGGRGALLLKVSSKVEKGVPLHKLSHGLKLIMPIADSELLWLERYSLDRQ